MAWPRIPQRGGASSAGLRWSRIQTRTDRPHSQIRAFLPGRQHHAHAAPVPGPSSRFRDLGRATPLCRGSAFLAVNPERSGAQCLRCCEHGRRQSQA